jgi:hypothetical protein
MPGVVGGGEPYRPCAENRDVDDAVALVHASDANPASVASRVKMISSILRGLTVERENIGT